MESIRRSSMSLLFINSRTAKYFFLHFRDTQSETPSFYSFEKQILSQNEGLNHRRSPQCPSQPSCCPSKRWFRRASEETSNSWSRHSCGEKSNCQHRLTLETKETTIWRARARMYSNSVLLAPQNSPTIAGWQGLDSPTSVSNFSAVVILTTNAALEVASLASALFK